MKRFINPDKSTWKSLTKRSSASYDSLEPLAKSIFKKVEKEGDPVSYTHLRAHETEADIVCRRLL